MRRRETDGKSSRPIVRKITPEALDRRTKEEEPKRVVRRAELPADRAEPHASSVTRRRLA